MPSAIVLRFISHDVVPGSGAPCLRLNPLQSASRHLGNLFHLPARLIICLVPSPLGRTVSIAALYKLERHHAGAHFMAMAAPTQGLVRYLHSHPATSERVGTLLGLTR